MKKDFETHHDVKNNVTSSVTLEFGQKFPDYKEKSLKELIEVYLIVGYLHNTETFALIDYKTDTKTYWINGKLQESKEEWEKAVNELKGEENDCKSV